MDRRRWLAITSYLIVFATLILLPLDFHAASAIGSQLHWGEWSALEPFRMLGHFLLFIPLGAAARSRIHSMNQSGVWIILMLMIAATFTELAQSVVQRDISVRDMLCNVLGAGMGCFGRSHFESWFLSALGSRFFCGMAIGLLALIVFLINAPMRVNWRNWNATFPLLIGDEHDRSRPWHGEILELAVYDRLLSSAEIEQLSSPSARSTLTLPSDSLINLQFGSRTLTASESDQGLDVTGLIYVRDQRDLAPMYDRLQATNILALVLRLRTADLDQVGPARVVGCSNGIKQRNFTLGQEGASLHWRVRNTITGENGTSPELVAPDSLQTDRFQTIVAMSDRAASRLYVDGQLRAKTRFSIFHRLAYSLFKAEVKPPLIAGLLIVSFILFAWLYFAMLDRFGSHMTRELLAGTLSITTLLAIMLLQKGLGLALESFFNS